ncbi:hypothetical protein ACFLY9_01265 [Patescibacteria group bacterium]
MKDKKVIAVIIIVVIMFLCVLCAGAFSLGYYFLSKEDSIQEEDESSEEVATDQDESDVEDEEDSIDIEGDSSTDTDQEEIEVPPVGYITGSLAYPSDHIPPQYVCAENTLTAGTWCTTTVLNQLTYSLEVPAPGTYYVYASLVDAEGGYIDYKAYYNEYVTCGGGVGCTSHDLVSVTVGIGDTLTDIDPVDWYNY